MKRIYLDYAAGAPLLPVVQERLQEYLQESPVGNPSSLHQEGRAKQAMLDGVHTRIAGLIGAQPTEVVLTSGATESNNLAIQGVVAAWRLEHPNKTPHIIMSAIEHPSWYITAEHIGAEITKVPVSLDGVVESSAVIQAIRDNTALIGCTYVNNEIGVVQPVAAIGKNVQSWRKNHHSPWPVFHTDAVQAFPYLNIHSGHLHADIITFSGHKYGAIEGIGCLVVRSGTPYTAALRGGNQEWGLRPGTENVLGAISLVHAMQYVFENQEAIITHVTSLQEELETSLHALLPRVRILGQLAPRAPHITYLWLPDVADEHIMHKLDLQGVAVASGSACSSGAALPSSTLLALGFNEREAFGGIRVSYGWATTDDEIKTFVHKLNQLLAG